MARRHAQGFGPISVIAQVAEVPIDRVYRLMRLESAPAPAHRVAGIYSWDLAEAVCFVTAYSSGEDE